MSQTDPPSPKQLLAFDPDTCRVFIDGSPISLTKTEFRVLQFLASRQGSACTRRQIIEAVQGEDYPVTERSVDVQMAGIRKKLGNAGRLIQTIRNVGFRFQEQEEG
jgi:two-component system, OmpR family, alkaline phosphatase synthesis response regulator PhoP